MPKTSLLDLDLNQKQPPPSSFHLKHFFFLEARPSFIAVTNRGLQMKRSLISSLKLCLRPNQVKTKVSEQQRCFMPLCLIFPPSSEMFRATEVISDQYSSSQNSQRHSAQGEDLCSSSPTPLGTSIHFHPPVNTSGIDVGSTHMRTLPV